MGLARAGEARDNDELGMPIVNECEDFQGIGADSQALQASLVRIRDGNFVDCGEFKVVLEPQQGYVRHVLPLAPLK